MCTLACMCAYIHLRYWWLPAHVLEWGGGETRCARGPLLEKQNHTFGVLPQFDD